MSNSNRARDSNELRQAFQAIRDAVDEAERAAIGKLEVDDSVSIQSDGWEQDDLEPEVE